MWVERTQKRYPKSWKYIKGVRRAIERHGERIKNISWDYAHKIGDLIVELAYRHKSVIILEDLEKLREKELSVARDSTRSSHCGSTAEYSSA
uniref:Uncharacterized protein n=1 Tax=Ignisphaera aggregans TaxID=334771 RepID=A0A7C5TGK9_9CREN